jgi:hypothetical protein
VGVALDSSLLLPSFLYKESPMIDPNKSVSPEVASECRVLAYERFRIDLLNTVEAHLIQFDMSWEQFRELLRRQCGWTSISTGGSLKKEIGSKNLTLSDLNDIMSVFSTEAHLIFKPRFPWIST